MKKPQGALIIGCIIVLVLFAWYHPVILSFFETQSENSKTPSIEYKSILIRNNKPSDPISWGDSEYYFIYTLGSLSIHAPFDVDSLPSIRIGEAYQRLGIEVKIMNVTSDYLSDYIVINARPLTESYMFDTYRLTKVDLSLGNTKAVSISSGIINQTNIYTFQYLYPPSTGVVAEFSVSTDSNSERYKAYVNLIATQAKDDFNIEIRTFKADSDHLVLYVKPLY